MGLFENHSNVTSLIFVELEEQQASCRRLILGVLYHGVDYQHVELFGSISRKPLHHAKKFLARLTKPKNVICTFRIIPHRNDIHTSISVRLAKDRAIRSSRPTEQAVRFQKAKDWHLRTFARSELTSGPLGWSYNFRPCVKYNQS